MNRSVSSHANARRRTPARRSDLQDVPRRHSLRPARRKRALHKTGSAYFWTAAEDRLLARTMNAPYRPDATRELAQRINRSLLALEARRRVKFGRLAPAPRPWAPREDRLLGTRLDTDVAELTRRHPGVVPARRRRLGILHMQATDLTIRRLRPRPCAPLRLG
jgi:hypothetical protein